MWERARIRRCGDSGYSRKKGPRRIPERNIRARPRRGGRTKAAPCIYRFRGFCREHYRMLTVVLAGRDDLF